MLTHSSDSFLAQHQAQVEEGGGGASAGVSGWEWSSDSLLLVLGSTLERQVKARV